MDARSFCSKVKFQGESVHLADLTSGFSFPEVTSKELIWGKEPPGELSASVEVRAITWVYKPTQNVKTLKCPGRQETNAEWQRRPVSTAMGKSRMWSLNTEVTWIPLNRQTEVRQFSWRGEKCMGETKRGCSCQGVFAMASAHLDSLADPDCFGKLSGIHLIPQHSTGILPELEFPFQRKEFSRQKMTCLPKRACSKLVTKED